MNIPRLLNVAKALREAPNPKTFSMNVYVHSCGSPACALGHYGCRPDLQDVFYQQNGSLIALNENGEETMCIMDVAQKHFDISSRETDELFEATGCGLAKTPHEAAEYIEDFVARAYPRVAMGAVCR
jgi:hypothetical protein